MFERTKSGQENRALFLGVDYVCYVEGGGGDSKRSEDASFWSKVFRICRPDIKVRCIARGGKPELEKLAREIIQEDLNGTLVAIDSDYDEFLGKKIKDRRVLYTFGYSWENDVFSISNLLSAHSELSNAENVTKDEEEFIKTAHSDACCSLHWAVRADLIALCARASVLPRKSPGRVVAICQKTHLPKLRRSEVLKIIREKNLATRPRNIPKIPKFPDVSRFCVGHVYAYVACAILRASYKKFVNRATPTINHVRDVCLLMFPEQLEIAGDPVSKHYHSVCAV